MHAHVQVHLTVVQRQLNRCEGDSDASIATTLFSYGGRLSGRRGLPRGVAVSTLRGSRLASGLVVR